jgi:hypothetical protein
MADPIPSNTNGLMAMRMATRLLSEAVKAMGMRLLGSLSSATEPGGFGPHAALDGSLMEAASELGANCLFA